MAEALMEIINTTLDHQSRHMITKKQQVMWDDSQVTWGDFLPEYVCMYNGKCVYMCVQLYDFVSFDSDWK